MALCAQWRLAVLALAALACLAAAQQEEGPEVTEEAASTFIARAQADPEGAFQEWKANCQKTYRNARVERRAFATWKERVIAAAAVNADPGRTFYASINCISDLPIPKPFPRLPPSTDVDIEPAIETAGVAARTSQPAAAGWGLGFKRPDLLTFTSSFRSAGFTDGTACPPDMDWRQIGILGGVKSQGDTCGSCWAFAAVGAIESAFALATGSLVDLADAQIVDCASGGSLGCGGGAPKEAFNYVNNIGGIQATATYGAYTGAQGACKFDPAKAAVLLSGFTDLPANSEGALLQAVCNQPVAIAIEANGAFMSYTGGIFSQPASSCGAQLNHAVLVVGYGVDLATSTPFWILRNSWGASWGEGGYMRILRGVNTCGLVSFPPSFPTVAGAPEPPPNSQPTPPDPPLPAADPSCPPKYTVKSGDTLFNIAGQYGINYLTLLAANPSIANPDLIFPGQNFTLPCPPKPLCTATVRVKQGDSLWAIGNAYGVGLQGMLADNPQLVDPTMIFPGDIVFVPPCTQNVELSAAKAVKFGRGSCISSTYTAKSGDTPHTVAATFSMQVGDLLRLNPALRRLATRVIQDRQVLNVLNCPRVVRLQYTAPRSCKSLYTVAAGNTLATVASKTSSTVAKLLVANPWLPASTPSAATLPTGRKLCVK